jgi:two-component system response regulator ArlR
MERSRILVVEDDPGISRFLELELKHEGFTVSIVGDGRSALATAENEAPNLIILDVMLPELNGIEVCRRIRMRSDVPIIMLTARDAVTDTITGLDVGADDYITKPFRIEELLARIRAALRRAPSAGRTGSEEIMVGELRISTAERRVWQGDEELNLTKREFDLLEYLSRNRGIVLSRDNLLENVWGWAAEVETNTVDVYIQYLRRKIDRSRESALIRTVRGVGYTIRDDG